VTFGLSTGIIVALVGLWRLRRPRTLFSPQGQLYLIILAALSCESPVVRGRPRFCGGRL